MTVRTSRRLLALVAALAASGMMAGTALAHAGLVSSSPADGTRVPANQVREVTLTFDDELLAEKSQFQLVDEGGTNVATGRVGADPRTMAADGLSLVPGAYQARWTAATPDGHITRGIVSFLAAAQASAGASPGGSAQPTPPDASLAVVAPTVSAADSSAGPGEPAPTDPGSVMAPITVVAAFIVLVAVLLARRSRVA